jgi:capsular polysaccharide transport system ATP-binding protein
MIEVQGVRKVYPTRSGPKVVLNGVNLTVHPGQKIGILGANGAGKSTLIRILSGAERATSGTVRRAMSVSWPLAFGGAFQGTLTGMDNLKFICRVHGVDYRDKIEYVEEFAELGKAMREPVKNFSSGMRARLAFAVSMAVDFDCFLIDEVIAVGDARFQAKCEIELFEKRADRACILVSHTPHSIEQHCDSAAVLHQGALHAFEAVASAYEFYQHVS